MQLVAAVVVVVVVVVAAVAVEAKLEVALVWPLAAVGALLVVVVTVLPAFVRPC